MRLLLLGFCLLLPADLAAQGTFTSPPKVRVYLFLGQSNVAYLDRGPLGPSSLRRPKVVYLSLLRPPSLDAPRPMMEIGSRLADHFPRDTILCINYGLPRSSLIQAYSRLGSRIIPWWVGGKGSILRTVAQASPWLRSIRPDSLVLIWSQGEMEMVYGAPATVYRDAALLAFHQVRTLWFGVPRIEVRLVPPGSVDSPFQPDRSTDGVRQAYSMLWGTRRPGIDVEFCATHHDLVMTDLYHHDFQGYVVLARRIADALIRPPLPLPQARFRTPREVVLLTPGESAFTNLDHGPPLFFLQQGKKLIPCRTAGGGREIRILPAEPLSAENPILLRYLQGSGWPGLWLHRGIEIDHRKPPPLVLPVAR